MYNKKEMAGWILPVLKGPSELVGVYGELESKRVAIGGGSGENLDHRVLPQYIATLQSQ